MDFPQSNPGEGGDQSATGGSPATPEAEQTASSLSGPASGHDVVPRGQFDRIYQKLERTEAQLRELKGKSQQAPEGPAQPDFDAQIAEWQKVADRAFDTDPTKYTQAMNQIAQLNSQKVVNSAMSQFLSSQQQVQQQKEFEQQNARSRDRAITEFPELKDQNSEFFKSVSALYDSDPYLQQDPNGVYRAAKLAWADRASGSKPHSQQLEGARPQSSPVPQEGVRADYNNAVGALKAGNKKSFQDFVTRNFQDLLYKDATRGQ